MPCPIFNSLKQTNEIKRVYLMIIYYTVASGCNSRHMLDVELFNKLKDAQSYRTSLPKGTAYKLVRHEAANKYSVMGDIQNQLLQERVI